MSIVMDHLRGNRLLFGLPSIVFVSFLMTAAGCASKTDATAAKDNEVDASSAESRLNVRAQQAEMRDIEVTVDGWGVCQAPPKQVASIMPAVEGQVEQILAKPGDEVKRDQAIVQLNQRMALANLAEKIATRDGLKASLKLLEAPPRPEELKSQESAVEQAKIAREKAQATVQRIQPLAVKGEIPGTQLIDAESAAKQALLQCDAAQAQLAAMKLGPRPEAVAEAKARIDTADAVVDSAQAQLDLLTMRSPIDGTLESLSCQLGQTIAVGTTVGEVVDASQMLVTVWQPPPVAARIAIGQPAHVWPETSMITSGTHESKSAGEPSPSETSGPDDLVGKVTFVGKMVDGQTGNLPVQIKVENSAGRLAIGQTVSVRITIDEKKNVLAVPAAAIFDTGEGSTLCLIRDGKSIQTHGQFGIRDKQWVELLASEIQPPVQAGDDVIVEGAYNLPDGTEVRKDAKQIETSEAPSKSDSAESTTATTASDEGHR